tara:strand:+ start:2109 stop:2684 length:576 start_codon:yes stop_codon:yes gene_type:complete
MKYLITDPQGGVIRVSETIPTDEELGGFLVYHEISDEDAATVEASQERLYYIDGSLTDFDGYIQNAKHQKYLSSLDQNDLEKSKKLSRDYYAEKRYDYEVSGTSVGGLAVRTDRFTVDRIYQARVLAKEDAAFTTDWKLGDGTFVTLDAATVIVIGDAVTVHLKDAFSKEKVANQSIDAATTIAELESIIW